MKQTKLWMLACCLIVLAACSNDDTPIKQEQERQHTEAVSELIRLMDGNPGVKALLEKSIAKAAEVNPDRRYNPAQTLTEFYDFVDWNVRQLPWDVMIQRLLLSHGGVRRAVCLVAHHLRQLVGRLAVNGGELERCLL